MSGGSWVFLACLRAVPCMRLIDTKGGYGGLMMLRPWEGDDEATKSVHEDDFLFWLCCVIDLAMFMSGVVGVLSGMLFYVIVPCHGDRFD